MKIFEVLKDSNGDFSHKRFIGTLGAFVLFGAFIYNIVNPKDIAINGELIQAVEYVVIACVCGTAAEKFSSKNEQG